MSPKRELTPASGVMLSGLLSRNSRITFKGQSGDQATGRWQPRARQYTMDIFIQGTVPVAVPNMSGLPSWYAVIASSVPDGTGSPCLAPGRFAEPQAAMWPRAFGPLATIAFCIHAGFLR